MGFGAGPPIPFNIRSESCLNGVALDVTCDCPKILFVFDYTRKKTILPDATGLLKLLIEILGIHLVSKADTARQGGFCLGNGEQMNMLLIRQ